MATKRIQTLKKKMLDSPRYASIEQAVITTRVYQENEDKSVALKRAYALKAALEDLSITVEPEELIVGNRTAGPRYGVVSPEGGSSWINREFEHLPTRPQDKFLVKDEDVKIFRETIYPYWKGKSLDDVIANRHGEEIARMNKVVKINQTDHSQGHIIPDTKRWLKKGPAGIRKEAQEHYENADADKKDFYKGIILVMEGTETFIRRYQKLLEETANNPSNADYRDDLLKTAQVCGNIAVRPVETFHEAVQATWFLYAILHMESNASSFSPGRLDQILAPYYQKEIDNSTLTRQNALEIIECLWIKFNQIVYLRNASSAKYFAGFPIGFNIAIGGQDENGDDYVNELSFLFLESQNHLLLPQPNLSVRLHDNTSDELLRKSIEVVAKGGGMPQFFNDESIIPGLEEVGIQHKNAMDYGIVGCVEVTTQGNNLGWSDAAMFNLNKALELTLNNGKCLITGESIGEDYGNLIDYQRYEDLEEALRKNITDFVDKMIIACEEVEKAHIELLPTSFLSSVIENCMDTGIDITAGGAKYNLSGIQMIQVANLADSLAAIKRLVFEEKRISAEELLQALKNDFSGNDILRATLLNKAPKYGNDVQWVDDIGNQWGIYFKEKLQKYTNYRGGVYHTGMYTVSAHVPMGENVGASPDGRCSQTPLADGGMSPVYGRDIKGPTAVLKSVSRLDSLLTTNGGLLNMKFLPEFFNTDSGIEKFMYFLRTFVDLKIPHIQFNVVHKEDLLGAQKDPEQYRSLTIRVAGYTAYFTELAERLQDEIIARTSYGDL